MVRECIIGIHSFCHTTQKEKNRRNFLGEEELLRSRGVRVEVLQDEQCVEMMRRFIEKNPKLWNEDIGE